ncbi:MAG TPA: hemerythrin domain-containing protein [Bdellovibrionales bacterium]|nr:hemerythrin domain-containing protein [Bdellovibrionales bacterium]
MAENESLDIVELILDDHKQLKELIAVLKDSEKDLSERRAAFEKFAPLLVTHAQPEELVLYTKMKDDEELREHGFEGEVEHQLADQLLMEAGETEDDDLWSARVKVLAELVEHHIDEEEKELLPEFKKHASAEERAKLGELFLAAKDNTKEDGSEYVPTTTRDIRQELQ